MVVDISCNSKRMIGVVELLEDRFSAVVVSGITLHLLEDGVFVLGAYGVFIDELGVVAQVF